ncbi:LysR family transcriptional regulator [Neokomagataea anthophila]|uniref:LysR family transcriptional regulator n=1 Tax=Neokomagataea anthophila TaxID=2826925 RepID=A0ABS5E3K2_9PROT|nr:LysR family transcriptional regulator [Neokomagataea anthophila]MBR0558477.1 LysR family transcriptional regulator [Neokomagataea anthophila]
MQRDNLVDLNAFVTVAEEGSFTRAAARLGVSQSALSHTIRRLEERLGIALLTRTTRSVAPTQAGQQLLQTLQPAFDGIAAQLASLGRLRDKPAGHIRITASEHAAQTILWPKLAAILPHYPDLHLEMSLDSGFRDIVSERFDAGVRLGEALAKDMVAVKIGPDLRMAVVGAPSYFARYSIPHTPQDLGDQRCINMRFVSAGTFYAWEFEKNGREYRIRCDGQLAFDDVNMIIRAAMGGFGLAYVMEDRVSQELADGRLIRVLEDWCPAFPGYYLYYPAKRQNSAALSLLIDTLRYRRGRA